MGKSYNSGLGVFGGTKLESGSVKLNKAIASKRTIKRNVLRNAFRNENANPNANSRRSPEDDFDLDEGDCTFNQGVALFKAEVSAGAIEIEEAVGSEEHIEDQVQTASPQVGACVVCLQDANERGGKVCLQPCGHLNVCRTCWETIVSGDPEAGRAGDQRCPTCRTEVTLWWNLGRTYT